MLDRYHNGPVDPYDSPRDRDPSHFCNEVGSVLYVEHDECPACGGDE